MAVGYFLSFSKNLFLSSQGLRGMQKTFHTAKDQLFFNTEPKHIQKCAFAICEHSLHPQLRLSYQFLKSQLSFSAQKRLKYVFLCQSTVSWGNLLFQSKDRSANQSTLSHLFRSQLIISLIHVK